MQMMGKEKPDRMVGGGSKVRRGEAATNVLDSEEEDEEEDKKEDEVAEESPSQSDAEQYHKRHDKDGMRVGVEEHDTSVEEVGFGVCVCLWQNRRSTAVSACLFHIAAVVMMGKVSCKADK